MSIYIQRGKVKSEEKRLLPFSPALAQFTWNIKPVGIKCVIELDQLNATFHCH